ncbi:hypothetical protein SOQ14_03850 [Erythrobacter sp. T5W1-R]|uniref:hypothetical protein n=1 Tax=Erythrobacter sp. T5W1-R TaxID=3101752 RepID=UPI002B000FEB|nr:hypothetical protein [Erythrobacter sp. T5W1-R]MEA1618044.1 hypothetical protein [Erythrobacter sp. T5W1-R]
MNTINMNTKTPDARAPKGNGTLRYTFVDTESLWDPGLVHAHRAIHPACQTNRIASRVITAAALFDVDIKPDGTLEFGEVKSWNARAHGGSYGVVKALFDNLAARENRVVVTWGGLATDQQVLILSAMENGLALPPHFREADTLPRKRLHLDLALAMKSSSPTYHRHHRGGADGGLTPWQAASGTSGQRRGSGVAPLAHRGFLFWAVAGA